MKINLKKKQKSWLSKSVVVACVPFILIHHKLVIFEQKSTHNHSYMILLLLLSALVLYGFERLLILIHTTFARTHAHANCLILCVRVHGFLSRDTAIPHTASKSVTPSIQLNAMQHPMSGSHCFGSVCVCGCVGSLHRCWAKCSEKSLQSTRTPKTNFTIPIGKAESEATTDKYNYQTELAVWQNMYNR